MKIASCCIAYRFRLISVGMHEHGLEDRRACSENGLVCANFLHSDPNREVRQQVVAEQTLVIVHQLLLEFERLKYNQLNLKKFRNN